MVFNIIRIYFICIDFLLKIWLVTRNKYFNDWWFKLKLHRVWWCSRFQEILANITGRFSNKNRTIDCRNLVFGLNIDIYHAKVDLQKLLDQEKILAITNQFHSSPKKNFSFNIDNKKISYEIDLDTRAVFWDITSEKVQILLDPPSLNIELPSDFFYPFVKMRNGYEKIVPKLFIVYCSVLCQWI